MGKSIFSIISSLVTVGIIIFLIYFCCLRKKRNNGQTFRTMIIGSPPPAAPQPQYPSATPYPTQHAQVWPNFGQPASQYPSNYTGAPYPTQNVHHLGTGMPMPSPVPNHGHFYAPSAPSAPMSENDLPPPYSSVVRGS